MVRKGSLLERALVVDGLHMGIGSRATRTGIDCCQACISLGGPSLRAERSRWRLGELRFVIRKGDGKSGGRFAVHGSPRRTCPRSNNVR